MLPQLREGVLWEMGRHLPPSPTNFSACRPSPSSSQGIAGRGVAVPHRTVEKAKRWSFRRSCYRHLKPSTNPKKACWWHSSCLKTYGLTQLFTVLKLIQGPKWILFIFHFLLNPADHFCSIGLVSLPPQTSCVTALRFCCSKRFWASKIISFVLLGSFGLALPCQNHCFLE